MYLEKQGLDWYTLCREPPVVRFQAERSNELWQFDISSSDLKQLKAPAWIDESKGEARGFPTMQTSWEIVKGP